MPGEISTSAGPARQRSVLVAVVLTACSLTGCGKAPMPARYEAADGFKITPPPGWALRDHEGGIPANAKHKPVLLPLPPLGKSEKLLVRYDRVSAGRTAWLRVSVTDRPSKSAREMVAACAPTGDWKREGEVDVVEVAGRPAARVAFKGRWHGEDFLNETVAVQKDDRVYLLSATFPAADTEAREAARQATLAASWQ